MNCIAGIATIPERENVIGDVVERVLPQVDHIFIACNRYGSSRVHPLMSRYPDCDRVFYSFPDHPDNEGQPTFNRQDNNKFMNLNGGPEGYRFPLDDDVLHPPTLIRDSIAALERYGRTSVVSWGGKRFDVLPIESFRDGITTLYHACRDQDEDDVVHLPLTGAMCWHTSMITFEIDDWVHPFMADVWAGVECARKGVPIVALAHKAGYLQHNPKADTENTIWLRTLEDDKRQVELINSTQWAAR